MRQTVSIILILLVIALAICAVLALRSQRSIGRSVALMQFALIPPVIGNLLIILSGNETVANIGCYIYFLGMDLVMFSLLRFTFDYCAISWPSRKLQILVYCVLAFDVIQFLCNPFFGQAFDTEPVMVDGYPYYSLVPLAGQTFHRVVDYSIFFSVLIIFAVKTIRSSRINSEKYWVILLTMVFVSLFQTFFIFSRTPVDRSMIGYGLFGLLIFYFSLRYRPLRLLDRMLAGIASELPEALFFFDAGDRCIWANPPGVSLAGIEGDNYDHVPDRLKQLFGDIDREEEWTSQKSLGTGDTQKSYVVEKHLVTDDRGRKAGSFLSVRDNTAEQRTLQKEIHKATHDALTDVYNRSGYDLILSGIEMESTFIVLIDIDRFKSVNDTYGHETGDRVLRRVADTIRRQFRVEDYVCRLGGDEFVVFMVHADLSMTRLIQEKIDRINGELRRFAAEDRHRATDENIPPISISAGIAHGSMAEDPAELFRNADLAMYESKRRGRSRYTFYPFDEEETLTDVR